MAATTSILVKESLEELKKTHSKLSPHLRARVKMLIALLKGVATVGGLAAKTGVTTQSIRNWKNKYKAGGIAALIAEGRGGDKRSRITHDQKQKIAQKLSDPKNAFTSFGQAQAWINKELGLNRKYHAVNKYLKRNFGAKLKAGRRSHVRKDQAAVAVFKKPAPADQRP